VKRAVQLSRLAEKLKSVVPFVRHARTVSNRVGPSISNPPEAPVRTTAAVFTWRLKIETRPFEHNAKRLFDAIQMARARVRAKCDGSRPPSLPVSQHARSLIARSALLHTHNNGTTRAHSFQLVSNISSPSRFFVSRNRCARRQSPRRTVIVIAADHDANASPGGRPVSVVIVIRLRYYSKVCGVFKNILFLVFRISRFFKRT